MGLCYWKWQLDRKSEEFQTGMMLVLSFEGLGGTEAA